jgi:hypothetical protein
MITSGGAAPARPTQFGRVTAVLTDLTMNVTGLTRVDIATPDLTSITIVRRLKSSTRARIMNQDATCKIQWRLPVGCLSFLKYFPLPYIESYAPLEIEFEFVDPRLCITLRDPTAARSAAIPEIPGEGEDPPIPAVPAMDITDNKIGYILSNPRFVVALVEPSEKVRDMHKSLYNGNGLWFPYVNYRHFLDRIDANSTNELLTFPANLSSARHVFTVLTSQNNDIATVAATQVIQSQSTFFRSSINYFRFQSGTMQFPDYGPCMVSNYMAGEAWAQLLLTFNIKENTVHKSRIRPWEWQSTTSEKFIIATPLSKDSSMWTGVAVKNNFLEMILNKAAVAVDYNAHTYIGYDCALVISKDRCNVFD